MYLMRIKESQRLRPWLILLHLLLVLSLVVWSLGTASPVIAEGEAPPATQEGASVLTGGSNDVAPAPAPVLEPSIATDKADYAPGESVVVSGWGFGTSELVRIVITNTDGTIVHDNTVGATDGSVEDTYLIPADGTASLEYYVEATGQSSGAVARVSFTDTGATIMSPFEVPQQTGAQPSLDPDQVILGGQLTISSTLYSASAQLLDLDYAGTPAGTPGDAFDDLTIDDDNPRALGTLTAGTYYVYWSLHKTADARAGHVEKFQIELSYSTVETMPPGTTVYSPSYQISLKQRAALVPSALNFLQGAPAAATALPGQAFEVRTKYKQTARIDDLIVEAYYDGTMVRLDHVNIYYYNTHSDPGSVASGIPGGWTTSGANTLHLGNMDGSDLDTVIPTLDQDDHWVIQYQFTVLDSGAFIIIPYLQTKRGNQWKLDSGFNEFSGLPGAIEGYKFNDLNGNGQRDEGEPGLSGWTIYLKRADAGDPRRSPREQTILSQTTTDNEGRYSFSNVWAGSYKAEENEPSGWTVTTGHPRDVTVVTNGTSQVDFGNFENASISGFKFNDLNGDGVWDLLLEPALSGWEIKAAKGDVLKTAVTDGSGFYEFTFSAAEAGTWVISETLQADWSQTAPVAGTYSIEVVSGTDEDNLNFGNIAAVLPFAPLGVALLGQPEPLPEAQTTDAAFLPFTVMPIRITDFSRGNPEPFEPRGGGAGWLVWLVVGLLAWSLMTAGAGLIVLRKQRAH